MCLCLAGIGQDTEFTVKHRITLISSIYIYICVYIHQCHKGRWHWYSRVDFSQSLHKHSCPAPKHWKYVEMVAPDPTKNNNLWKRKDKAKVKIKQITYIRNLSFSGQRWLLCTHEMDLKCIYKSDRRLEGERFSLYPWREFSLEWVWGHFLYEHTVWM